MTTLLLDQHGWTQPMAKACAAALGNAGYHFIITIPHNYPGEKYLAIRGKSPGKFSNNSWFPPKGWDDPETKQDHISAFANIGSNTKYVPNLGVLCGLSVTLNGQHAGVLAALDIDAADEATISEFDKLFGYSNPIRRGKLGGTYLMIVTGCDAGVLGRDFHRGAKENGEQIQILAKGKHTCVMGIHPTTLKPYRWEVSALDINGTPASILPIADLPIVSLAALEAIIVAAGYARGKHEKKQSAEEMSALTKREAEIVADLKKTAAMDYADVEAVFDMKRAIEDDRGLREKILADHDDVENHNGNDMAIANLLHKHFGKAFNHHHLRAVLSNFDACSAEEKQTERYVARIAAKMELVGSIIDSKVDYSVDDEDGNAGPSPEQAELVEKHSKAKAIKLSKSKMLDAFVNSPRSFKAGTSVSSLPPRRYIWGTYLQKGTMTLLSAAGGVGKSAFGLSAAIDLACGVDHLGMGEFRKRRVFVYNAEDSIEELERRAFSYMQFHGFTPQMQRDVEDNLRFISGVTNSIRFAAIVDRAPTLDEDAFAAFDRMLDVHNPEVVILDPLISLHSLPENSNDEMAVLIGRFREMTARRDVATMLCHHITKGGREQSVEEVSQESSRGAGSIVSQMRTVVSMKTLSSADAVARGIPAELRHNIVTLSKGAKSNYSEKDPTAKLLMKHTVVADNGDAEFAADRNVALAVFQPGARAGFSLTVEQRDKVLSQIGGGKELRVDPRAKSYAVRVVAELAGFELTPVSRVQVKAVLDDWQARGWVKVVEAYSAEAKRSVDLYRIGPNTPPAEIAFGAVEDEDED